MSVPLVEIHNSGQPLAMFFTTTGKIFTYPIKTKGRYFVKNNSNVKGIYSINHKYRYSWNKTPIYLFAAQESNQIDPIMIDQLNRYLKTNQLVELRRKDVKHGSRLRTLMKQNKTIADSITQIKVEEQVKDISLQEKISGITSAVDQRIKDLHDKHDKDLDVPDSQRAFILLEHLKSIGKIDDIEYADLMNKAESGALTFDSLVDELKEKHVVTVSEPLNQNVEDFIQDLGMANAQDLAGFVQDLTINKKGLKDLTPVPLKSVWTPGLLLAVIIGGMIGVVLLGQHFGEITNAVGNSQASSGIKMPWQIFGGGFVYPLMKHLPDFMLSWFI